MTLTGANNMTKLEMLDELKKLYRQILAVGCYIEGLPEAESPLTLYLPEVKTVSNSELGVVNSVVTEAMRARLIPILIDKLAALNQARVELEARVISEAFQPESWQQAGLTKRVYGDPTTDRKWEVAGSPTGRLIESKPEMQELPRGFADDTARAVNPIPAGFKDTSALFEYDAVEERIRARRRLEEAQGKEG